jgi:hypothetical protein
MQVREGRGYAYQRSSFGPEFLVLTGLAPLYLVTGSTTEIVSVPRSVPEAPTSGDAKDDGDSQQR